MGDVVFMQTVTTLDIPPERVLRAAVDAGLVDVIVIGRLADKSRYFASSMADGGDALWLLAKAEKDLLAMGDE